MSNWITKHKLITLSLSLLVLVGLNIWMFGSHFIDQKQLLTAQQLDQYNQQLSEIADQASKLTHRQSTKPLSENQTASAFQDLQHRSDEVVLDLKTSSYPKELNERVEQTLELAEVLSFTLHNYQLQPATSLSSANISQVFRQTSINAANLNNGQ